MTYKEFVTNHQHQLKTADFPESLWKTLYNKLSNDVFDSGKFFELAYNQNTEKLSVVSKKALNKNSNCFLVDHFWTAPVGQIRSQLRSNSKLAERFSGMTLVKLEEENELAIEEQRLKKQKLEEVMEIYNEKEEIKIEDLKIDTQLLEEKIDLVIKTTSKPTLFQDIEFDDLDLTSFSQLPFEEIQEYSSISLWGTKILKIDEKDLELLKKFTNLRSLWLNDTPLFKNMTSRISYLKKLPETIPSLEILDSKFTHNYTTWAVLKTNKITEKSIKKVWKLDLQERFSEFPYLKDEVFQEFIAVQQLDLRNNKGLFKKPNLEVIGHMRVLRSLLIDLPQRIGINKILDLVSKTMPNLVFINGIEIREMAKFNFAKERNISLLFDSVFKHNQTYSYQADNKLTHNLWYVLDELGTSFTHHDNPNFRIIPFIYLPKMFTCSITWPVSNVKVDDVCTRNFIEGTKEDYLQKIKKAFVYDLLEEEEKSEYTKEIKLKYQKYLKGLSEIENEENGNENEKEKEKENENEKTKEKEIKIDNEKETEKKKEKEKEKETEKKKETESKKESEKKKKTEIKPKFKIFTNWDLIKNSVTRKEFSFGDFDKFQKIKDKKTKEKMIYWNHKQINKEEFKKLIKNEKQSNIYVNQFKGEQSLTVKDLLIETMKNYFGKKYTEIIPESYVLSSQEIELFLGNYLEREDNKQDNFWIMKPWNLTRGMEITVTESLKHIIRTVEESRPRVVSKYISDPVLFQRRKFDLRFITMVRKIEPETECFVYSEFWPRFSNKDFALELLDDYQRHFTVMNYSESFKLKNVSFTDFVKQFELEYGLEKGLFNSKLLPKIYNLIKQSVIASRENAKRGKRGLIDGPYRAIYGYDIMLRWDEKYNGRQSNVIDYIRPVLLEVNFTPDCHRAVVQNPDFFNHIFGNLFLNEETHCIRI
ncbi:tubulin--tyrosine ligase-like protein [Anaeramoeba flamelloides]|uniref:Tubulin--tyrosine ligase-like protein n=1 Tax=Anaeramoeba flamelloides TaxID=1746091 RepID=A0ABQ8XKP9_9EUKA|nr:tubulin--tyrosine ligase-like protein [Anaeramoeba flamelloides]